MKFDIHYSTITGNVVIEIDDFTEIRFSQFIWGNVTVKKREKAGDFIGWVSEDGNLEVVDIFTKQGCSVLYKVVCKICSQDPELFPDGYFVCRKDHLKNGVKPCGCSLAPRLKEKQYLIILERKYGDRIIIKGLVEKFKGIKTKLDCECRIDKYQWKPTIDQLIHSSPECPKCYGNARLTENEAMEKCLELCKKENYKPLGFVNGYIDAIKTRFEYECPKHGVQNVSYHNFVLHGGRCKGCSKYGYDVNKPGSFYIVKWTKENHSFIKFGITNRDVVIRIEEQLKNTKYDYEIIFQQKWEDGKIADNLEKSIKSSDIFIKGST